MENPSTFCSISTVIPSVLILTVNSSYGILSLINVSTVLFVKINSRSRGSSGGVPPLVCSYDGLKKDTAIIITAIFTASKTKNRIIHIFFFILQLSCQVQELVRIAVFLVF